MDPLSNKLKDLPVECGPDVSDSSIEKIPESYIWSEEERQPIEQVEPNAVPVIDLHGLWHLDEQTDKDIIQQIAAAACKNGFFQVINHGVSAKLFENMELQGRRLFSLPIEKKLKTQRAPPKISGYGLADNATTFFKKKLWCEGFTCVGSALEHAKKLWPEDHQQFCDTMHEYDREMKRLAIKMMSLFGKSLGVTRWCDELDLDKAFGICHMNYYSSCPEPLKAMGLGPHTDSHLITLLYQGDVEGLHYLHNGKWILAPVVPNALEVIVGDLFEMLSNGRYKSPLHRAVPNKSRSRISIAYFWGPPLAAVIKPAPHLVDSEHPPLYKSVARKEFLRAKGESSGDGLSLFRTEQSQLPEESN